MWSWFEEIYDPGFSGGMGPSLLTYGEIDAYCRLTGTRMYRNEIRALRQLSLLFVSEQQEREKANRTGVKKQVSMDDTEGLKNLFKRQTTKARQRKK